MSQERLDQLLYASPSARGKHVSLAEWNSVLEKADTEIAELNSLGASLITMFDGPETYPGRLLECYRPPVFLQILGDATVLLRDCIAIVGSRKPTPEGIRAASDFAGQLAAAGLVVVSGLAYGIDKAAHVGCLDAGGQTIAVLGSSIDEIYPTIHVPIARSIAQNNRGAVISEFHLHMQPTVYTFPQRNRVISGLSLGVLVVEAAKESGSLITANFALEQNREVFAIPGSIYAPQHVGTNALIKSGAKLVQSVQDVLDELPGFKAAPEEHPSEALSQQELTIAGCIQTGCTSVDLLCERLAYTAPQVLSVLT
ncbi:DNA-processing protein DprA, partial [Candidatus Cryosericum odellii]|uniref:DNA-processing protein DprA n=1 Tax=Candidatus Cryosericum odellii TaxID=2290917 RepID=UPI001A9F4E48